MKGFSQFFLLACSTTGAVLADSIDFNSQIKSLLSNRCIACHGPDEEHREAGLRLDTFEGATRDLDGYSAIVPGNPEESEILFRVTLELSLIHISEPTRP